MNTPPAPAVQRLGSAVLLQGQAVLAAQGLIAIGVRETTRRDGISPSPGLQALLRVLSEVALDIRSESAPGRPQTVPIVADAASSTVQDELTTNEVATMLGIGARQVRRLAPGLGGHLVRGSWIFPRSAIDSTFHSRCNSNERDHR